MTLPAVQLPSSHGMFQLELIANEQDSILPHVVLSRTQEPSSIPLIRIHSECLTGDVFGSLRCDCGPQLNAAQALMAQEKHAYLFYLRQEGRGIGLEAKMQAYLLQEQGRDTVQANLELGHPADARTYEMVSQFLLNKGINRVRLLTNNPEKTLFLEQAGIAVTREPLLVGHAPENEQYRRTKREYFKHDID